VATLTAVTVLKTGGEYTAEHAWRLFRQIEDTTPDVRLACLSDDPTAPYRIPLEHDWPGWWSKIELFRAGLFDGPVVFLDLDTDVVGDLRNLIRPDFTMLSDFYRPQQPASGLMAWMGDAPNEVYCAFSKAPDANRAAYRSGRRWGDQGFIRDKLHQQPERFGSEAVSYKKHCRPAGQVPSGAVVVCYHGKPRPWDCDASWLYAVEQARRRIDIRESAQG